MIWGESREAVYSYLRTQGLPPPEAKELLAALEAERAREVRASGLRKIVLGAALMIAPVAFWILSELTIGRIYLYPLAAAIIGACYGISKFIDGIRAVAAPKSDSSDLSAD